MKRDYLTVTKPLTNFAANEEKPYYYRMLEKKYADGSDVIIITGPRGAGSFEIMDKFCAEYADDETFCAYIKNTDSNSVFTDMVNDGVPLEYRKVFIMGATNADAFWHIGDFIEVCRRCGCRVVIEGENSAVMLKAAEGQQAAAVVCTPLYADRCLSESKCSLHNFMCGGDSLFGGIKGRDALAEDVYRSSGRYWNGWDSGNYEDISVRDISDTIGLIVRLAAEKPEALKRMVMHEKGAFRTEMEKAGLSLESNKYDRIIYLLRKSGVIRETSVLFNGGRKYPVVMLPYLFAEYMNCDNEKINRNIMINTVAAQLMAEEGTAARGDYSLTLPVDDSCDLVLADQDRKRALLIGVVRRAEESGEGCFRKAETVCITTADFELSEEIRNYVSIQTLLSDTANVFKKYFPKASDKSEIWEDAAESEE